MANKDTRAGHMDEQPPEPASIRVHDGHLKRLNSLKSSVRELEAVLQQAKDGDEELVMPSPEEMLAIAAEAEAESSDNIILSACAMLQAFLDVDEEFIRTALARFVVVTPAVLKAAQEDRLPLRVAKLPDGRSVVGFMSFINAFLLWMGADNFIQAEAGVADAAGHRKIVGFVPALPLKVHHDK